MKTRFKQFNRVTKILVSTLLMLLLVLIVWLSILFNGQKNIQIAIVGPMSESAIFGKEMVRGAQLYLDRVNKEEGINGKKFELITFDDRNDPNLAREKALEIAKSTEALAVLGHFSSFASIIGGEIYQEFGMPAITGSATAQQVTEGNDWYFRTVFNNHYQSVFLAHYVKEVLNSSKATIIYNQNNYGTTLANGFEKTFVDLGGKIQNKWSLSETENLEDWQNQSFWDLLADKTQNDPGVILLAAHNGELVNAIFQIRQKGLNYPIIGADSVGKVTFATRFDKYYEEQETPGYYTDGIYATAPIIFDVAGEKAQYFRNEYIEKYGKEPDWIAATYYDAARFAVEAIKKAQVNDEQSDLTEDSEQSNLAKERQKVKTALAGINTEENSIEGLVGKLYFDSNGDLVVKSINVGIFDRQRFISAWTQLKPVENTQEGKELQDQQKLLVENQYMEKTDVAYVGLDINEISNLNEKESTYLVDFFLWFRFRKNINADDIVFINYAEDWLKSEARLDSVEPIAEKTIEGATYRCYRIKAYFQGNFDFHKYPFDVQKLVIKFRHNYLTASQLIYVVDQLGMRDIFSKDVLSNLRMSQVFEDITGWKAERVKFFQDTIHNDSSLGDPQLFSFDSEISYSRFNASIEIKREWLSFIIKQLLPLLFFIGVSYLILFLPFDLISVEALSSLLLAVVFFHLNLLESLPSDGIGYVVLLDYIFYVIYGSFCVQLLLVVLSQRKNLQGDTILSQRFIVMSRAVFPTVFLIAIIFSVYMYFNLS
jgi:branched-chain amino acid transport system substrate-binding protein